MVVMVVMVRGGNRHFPVDTYSTPAFLCVVCFLWSSRETDCDAYRGPLFSGRLLYFVEGE